MLTEDERDSTHLVSASKDRLNVIAEGDWNEDLTGVCSITNIGGNIVSTPKLRDRNFWFISPGIKASKDHAAYVVDGDTGKVVAVSDSEFNIDLRDWRSFNTSIELPELPDVQEELRLPTSRQSNVNKVYGYSPKSASDLVLFTQQALLLPQAEILWMIRSQAVDNFPITESMCKKYWVQEICRIMGNMQLRKTDNRQYESQAYLEDNPNPKRGKRKALEEQSVRASHVGHYVGGDIFGPFMNMAMHAVVDAYSGFGRSKPMQYSSKSPFKPTPYGDYPLSQLPKSFQWCVYYYEKYGHHIDNFISDPQSVYQSVNFNQIVEQYACKLLLAPAGDHSRAGLPESFIKTISYRVTAMFCLAPWMPHKIWCRIWDTAEIVNSMRQSKDGSRMTRLEKFTHIKPNLFKIVILPNGIPIEYLMPKENRSGFFADHARIGMYVGPNLLTDGGIWIYNPVTQRFATRTTYVVLDYSQVPKSWPRYRPLSGYNPEQKKNVKKKDYGLDAEQSEDVTELAPLSAHSSHEVEDNLSTEPSNELITDPTTATEPQHTPK
jgi:hypothetical protein